MSLFKKEIKELKEQMNQLKEYVLQFKDDIENMDIPLYNLTRFREVFELYKTLERCCESFNKHQNDVPSNTFNISDNILSPEFSSNDPIKTLHEGLEHLKKLQGFLIEFKSDLENLPDVPRKPKQIIKISKPQKTQSLRLPSMMLSVDNDIEIVAENILIEHPESPTVVAKSKISIDRELVGNDYVPFNLAIPDEREINRPTLLNEPSTSNPIIDNDFIVPNCIVIPDRSILLNHPSTSKHITSKASSSGISEVFHHNIPFQPEEVETVPEIQSAPNILQSPSIAEVPALKPIMDIDQNAMEILQEISQQKFLRKKAMIRLSQSTSSDNTENAQIVSCAPKPLKKTKFRKIDKLVMLPQDTSTYRISPHYFDFQFNIHAQGVIDAILKIRSNLKPSLNSKITQASTQQNVDTIQTQLIEEPLLTRSQTEVQRVLTNQSQFEKSLNIPYVTIQPDQQSEIQVSTLDYNTELPSVVLEVAQISQRSPLPLISMHEREAAKEKLPDKAYTHFESVLQKNNSNKKATPIKNVKPSSVDTGSKSLRLMSQADLVKNMDHDQYVSFCILREIQRKYSKSNQIDIKSIRKHFGTDRIGFCKLIRTTIDLQCHDLIRILKNENSSEIAGIEIFES